MAAQLDCAILKLVGLHNDRCRALAEIAATYINLFVCKSRHYAFEYSHMSI